MRRATDNPAVTASLLARFLHVRRSELDRTLQVAGFAIVLGWAMYTAFNATQAIFLIKAGPHAYPLFFIVLALAVWPMVALQGVLTRRLGVGRALRLNLIVNAAIAPMLYIAYQISEAPAVAFTVYVIYSIAFELVMLNFWSFVSQHFNLLEGKRVFPVIAAGSSIGYILAGFTTTLVAIYATEPLLFVWAIGAAAAALMSEWVERRLFRPSFIDDADELYASQEVDRHRQGLFRILRGAIQYVTTSRLVLSLVLLALVLQVTGRVGDYLVALIFVAATHHNLQSLTILIGDAWLASYVVQLAVSLFITPWVMDKLGVKNAIMALPVFTLIGFAAVCGSPDGRRPSIGSAAGPGIGRGSRADRHRARHPFHCRGLACARPLRLGHLRATTHTRSFLERLPARPWAPDACGDRRAARLHSRRRRQVPVVRGRCTWEAGAGNIRGDAARAAGVAGPASTQARSPAGATEIGNGRSAAGRRERPRRMGGRGRGSCRSRPRPAMGPVRRAASQVVAFRQIGRAHV